MKAFVLAAGGGTRLRPLTDTVPKCLVPIGGVPLLTLWLLALREAGVDRVLVNTHHLAEVVQAYAMTVPVAGVEITLSHETTLRGSGGTLAANRHFVQHEEAFWIVYADNLTNASLAPFLHFHRAREAAFTMGLFETDQPEQCGIARLDTSDRIVAFEEKPRVPAGRLANAGLYLAGPSLFDYIPDRPYSDVGHDVLPAMVGRMHGYRIDGFYCDIGTPERLERARREWAGLPPRMGSNETDGGLPC